MKLYAVFFAVIAVAAWFFPPAQSAVSALALFSALGCLGFGSARARADRYKRNLERLGYDPGQDIPDPPPPLRRIV